jgi:cytochrome c peroxidase
MRGNSAFSKARYALVLFACGCDQSTAMLEPAPKATASEVAAATSGADAPEGASDALGGKFNPRLLRRFKSLRDVVTDSDRDPTSTQVDLGRMLYYEERISAAQNLSCNGCHPLERYGSDGRTVAVGFEGQPGARNTPTTYNAAGYFRQFWDGRAKDVEEQALMPILNPIEMAAPSEQYVLDVLASMPEYQERFLAAFPDEKKPLNWRNIGVAIGAFERGLTTRSRWDAFLEGKQEALTAGEVEGLRLFTNVGCMVCHTGELIGGSMFERLGAVEPWPNQADRGRFEVTEHEGDEMMFKVPTLRNVAETGPYFHDGSARTLSDAVTMMGKHQLGLELSSEEVASIVAWLRALTGELPRAYIQRPDLPASTASTPKPVRGT